MTMDEHYLEWLFLREHLDYWINTQFPLDGKEQYFFDGKEYNVEAMKARYIELTKQLLKDYEI